MKWEAAGPRSNRFGDTKTSMKTIEFSLSGIGDWKVFLLHVAAYFRGYLLRCGYHMRSHRWGSGSEVVWLFIGLFGISEL